MSYQPVAEENNADASSHQNNASRKSLKNQKGQQR